MSSPVDHQAAMENGSTGRTGEQEHIVVNYGSAEEQSVVNNIPHQRWSKKDKALTAASTLLIIGAIAFVVAVYRPGGLGSDKSSIQSSQGLVVTNDPTFYPTSNRPTTYKPTDNVEILDGATSFQTAAKTDKGGGEGEEVPGIKPIITFTFATDPAPSPTQNSAADGSGELVPVPTSPPVQTWPFITPFPMDTPFPIDTPTPTSMPSVAATESFTSLSSGQGTETVSTETTGPPTLPNRDPVRM